MQEVSQAAPAPKKDERAKKLIQGVVSLLLIGAVFFYALPKIADFSEVWGSIRAMSPLEIGTLIFAALWNIITYWFVIVASLPGSNVWQAMKVNQASTAVANTLPGGGALGLGVTFGMFSGYGFSRSEISLSVLVSGIWNNFVKLGMPIIALAALAVSGGASPGLMSAAVVGVIVLVGAILVFSATLRSDALARKVGDGLAHVANPVRRLLRKPPVQGWGESAVGFRSKTVTLLHDRWVRLTVATLVSHFSLYLVLLLALRHVGVSQSEVGWAEVLAAFAFVRLISALPITPGGLGVVELGLTAALVAAGGNEPQVVASVLIYRALTYLLPIPLGAALYLKWKKGAEARRLRLAQSSPTPGVAGKVS
ncbi:MAG: putative heme transporter [Actinomycetota bacterium]|nr:putative heme transporter [Actinomycetota bacterium]